MAARQEDEGADEDLSQAPRRTAPQPVAPPSSGPAAWLCRYCEHDATPFGDTVAIVCQARDAPLGCCWHLGCLRGEEERNAARRALMVPHSRWACPSGSCRVGVVALGPGMGRYDGAHGGFDPGGGVTPTAADEPLSDRRRLLCRRVIAVGLGSAQCALCADFQGELY